MAYTTTCTTVQAVV